MGLPAARKTDSVKHRHDYDDVILEGSSNVHINNLPAARLSDKVRHGKVPPWITSGEPTVHINNRLAARVTDSVSCGGRISIGSPNVHIGVDHRQQCLQDAAESGTMTLDMPSGDGF